MDEENVSLVRSFVIAIWCAMIVVSFYNKPGASDDDDGKKKKKESDDVAKGAPTDGEA